MTKIASLTIERDVVHLHINGDVTHLHINGRVAHLTIADQRSTDRASKEAFEGEPARKATATEPEFSDRFFHEMKQSPTWEVSSTRFEDFRAVPVATTHAEQYPPGTQFFTDGRPPVLPGQGGPPQQSPKLKEWLEMPFDPFLDDKPGEGDRFQGE